MKFFDRKEEIATLQKIRNNAEINAQFTVSMFTIKDIRKKIFSPYIHLPVVSQSMWSC